MIIKVKDSEPFELSKDYYINPSGWFGHTFLIEYNWSNACTHQFVVEADNEQEAINELLDSKFGYIFKVSKEEMEELFNEWASSDKSDEYVFMDWLEEFKDISFGGNFGHPYHSDMFLYNCVNRCNVEGFDYEKEDEND